MTQGSLNGLATLSINCEMDRKLGCTTIIHDFADKTNEIVAILQTAVVN